MDGNAGFTDLQQIPEGSPTDDSMDEGGKQINYTGSNVNRRQSQFPDDMKIPYSKPAKQGTAEVTKAELEEIEKHEDAEENSAMLKRGEDLSLSDLESPEKK